MSSATLGTVQKKHMEIVDTKFYSPYLPAAVANNIIKAATQIADGVLAALTQPAVPRVLTVTITDADGNLVHGTVTVIGLDQNGKPATDVFTTAAQATYTGEIAFSAITSITLAGYTNTTGAGDTISVGVSDDFGLPCGDGALDSVFFESLDKAAQVINTAGIDKTYGTYNPTGVPNAAKELTIGYKVIHRLFME